MPVDFKNTHWRTAIFIVSYHTLLALLLPLYLVFFGQPSLLLIILTLFFIICCGFGITAGYHRLYAHKTYTINKLLEPIILFFGTLNMQGSVLIWSQNHRIHHQYTDSEKDPHSITKGFFHAHMGWLFRKAKAQECVVVDLKENALLRFQDRFYVPLAIGAQFVVFAIMIMFTGDIIGSFIFGFLLRIFLNHHTTWFINSLAHLKGGKNYSPAESAADNFLVAFVTYGEGYHNYHHTFPSDYRNGIRWYHFDPTKVLIWVWRILGLASNLKTIDWPLIAKRKIVEEKTSLLSKISDQRKDLVQIIAELSDSLTVKLSELSTLRGYYKEKASTLGKQELTQLNSKIKEVATLTKRELKQWKQLSQQLSMTPSLLSE